MIRTRKPPSDEEVDALFSEHMREAGRIAEHMKTVPGNIEDHMTIFAIAFAAAMAAANNTVNDADPGGLRELIKIAQANMETFAWQFHKALGRVDAASRPSKNTSH